MSFPSLFSVLFDGVFLNAGGLPAITGNPLTIALLSVVELIDGYKVTGAVVLLCSRRYSVVSRRRTVSVLTEELLVDGLTVDELFLPPCVSLSLVILSAAV
jgi:hypothetical protein